MNDTDIDKAGRELKKISRGHQDYKLDIWGFSKFFKEDILSLGIKWGGSEQHQANNITLIQKLWREIAEKPMSSIKPHLIFDPKYGKKVKQIFRMNVLLLEGLRLSARRDFGLDATVVDFIELGTDGTGELETQTNVITPTGNRKQYSIEGSRSVAVGSQTAKAVMTFLDTDGFTPPVTIKEAGQINLASGGDGHSRVQIPDLLFEAGDAILTQFNELHANG